MKFQDLTTLLEQDESIFKPRRVGDRLERQQQKQLRKVHDYINNGSKGDLDLRNTMLTTLPGGLHVDGNLILTGSKITHLPDDIKINGGLYLAKSQITRLPDNLKIDDLGLSMTQNITQLPRGLSVNRKIVCDVSRITYIPDDIQVGEEMSLMKAFNIKRLPDNLTLYELNIKYTKIESLPNNLTADSVSASGSLIKHIPPNNKIKRLIIYHTLLSKDPDIMSARSGEHNPKYPNIGTIFY